MNENCRNKLAMIIPVIDDDDDVVGEQKFNNTIEKLQSFILNKYNMIIDMDTMLMIQSKYFQHQQSDNESSFNRMIQSIFKEFDLKSTKNDDDDDKFFTNIGGDFNHDQDDDQIDNQIETNKKLDIDSAVDLDDSPSSACNHYWQLWFWKSDQWYIEWDYGLQKLAKPFNGRQRLLKLFDQLLPLSDIVIPSDYSIFRELIRPKWEDSANLNGGAWIIEFERCSLITDMKLMENIWHSLVEFIVEKHCNNNDCSLFKHICGIKISIRFKVFIISIWIDTFNDLSIIFPIGIRIQSIIMEIIQNNRRIRLSETIDNSTTTTTTSLYHYHTLPLLLFRSHIVSKRIAANKDVNIIGGCSAAAAAAAGGKKYFNSAGLFNHHLKSKNK